MPERDIKKIGDVSADYNAMLDYWKLVNAIVDGIRSMRAAKTAYLPKFPNESSGDYDLRLKTSTMTNVYRDVLESIVTKPFSEQANIQGDNISDQIKEIVSDIDGSGNHLHVFLQDAFFRGVNNAIDWILVDYPTIDTSDIVTKADEKRAGIRPYWVHIAALDVLEVASTNINGVEKITYFRFLENINTVRVFEIEPGSKVPTWTTYVKNNKTAEWEIQKAGVITIPEIPVVPIITGRRKGKSWIFYPPLSDAADLQVELFQKETALKNIENLTCFPMLTANGIEPDRDKEGNPKPVPMGPNAVLYAPPNDNGSTGQWDRIAADADSLRFLSEHIEKIINRIRELGKQPLTAQSASVTRINASFAAGKANSAVQSWAIGTKDAAEMAFYFTKLWLNDTSEFTVFIFTDFPVETDNDNSPDILLSMRDKGDLSQKTLWLELRRRKILSRDFDPETEITNLTEEYPTDPPTNLDVNNAAGLT